MKYGYYDNDNREYVITRPDTPTPWLNYLGDGGFSGIISNTAGGLVFDRDPETFITRYNFNRIPYDRPGRYLYFKDMGSGAVWSPTWQPVQAELDSYSCRHGMGYTRISSEKDGIQSEITYFIPEGKQYEIWKGTVKNTSATVKNLKLFSYVEFSCYIAKYDIDRLPIFLTAGEGNAIIFNPSDDFIRKAVAAVPLTCP
ncbi:MAG: hypothetical protein ACLTDS_14790 [Bianqueaceae bacterium]